MQQMERFKACEKEMKTKAFSKEGLSAAARLDPSEKAKVETAQWLSSMVDELSRQIEATEAEMEQALSTTKKGKKGSMKDDRVGTMEHQNERRNWHISRLEILLRMLENGTLEPERANEIKDDIAYFVESNAEEEFEEDEGIYDEFNLEEEEGAFGLRENEDGASPPAEAGSAEAAPAPAPESPAPPAEEPPKPKEKEPAPKPAEPKKEEPAPPKPKEEAPSKKKEKDSKKGNSAETNKERVVLATNFDQGRVQPASAPVAPRAAPAAPLPPVRYATAAAAAVASPTSAAAQPAPPMALPADGQAPGGVSAETEGTEHEAPAGAGAEAAYALGDRGRPAGDARLPGSLSDLVSSFESAKQKSLLRDSNLAHVQRSLESSFAGGVPSAVDSESPKYYVPKESFATPHYYPQTPASVFDNPALYSKFDVDTLFYIFYYQQGTYHQYLAARELKKQSWRFHKQYLTWFQRHSEPQAITDEYEQGAYVYFDWEGSWCQRKKSDFRFEYRWLEDN